MRLRWIVRATVLVAVGLSAWGCKNDTTAPLPISLNQAEVAQWFSELRDVDISIWDVVGPIDKSINCPSGGTARAVGSRSSTTYETWDVTITYSACKTTSYTTGGSWRDTGSFGPGSNSTTLSGTVTLTASGGRSGTCVVDVMELNNGLTYTVSGTICGFAASTIVSYRVTLGAASAGQAGVGLAR